MSALREYAGVPFTELPRDAHLLQPVLERARIEPQRPIGGYRDGSSYVDVPMRTFVDELRSIARGLIACGVEFGDRVALMSGTRMEWLTCDYGIMGAGGVTVPIYDTSSAEQIRWIVSDSNAKVLILETEEHLAAYEQVADDLVECTHVFVIARGGLDELVERGAEVDPSEVDARIDRLTVDDLATIIYTSGTTGRPKGCMLTHRNLRTNVQQDLAVIADQLGDDETSLIFLPLAHSLAKIITLVAIEHGIAGYMATDIAHVPEELPIVQPTIVVSVPRVFEKVYNRARQTAVDDGKARIFDKASDIAIRYSKATETGRAGLLLRLGHAVFDRLVYRRLRAAMGGSLRYAFSGGGPLGARLTHYFNGVGIQIFEGYGLTETSPILTVNSPDAWRPGTVGRPLPGTTIRIADDGEILAKGPQIFRGYWKNIQATEEIFTDDGWFRTGDIGELDEEGFLRITGRKKDLIVTAAGKNIAPAPLEDTLRAHPLISQALVIGDQRPFVGALIAIDEEAFPAWATAHGKEGATIADLVEDPDLRAEIQAAIDGANAQVSRAEAIKAFRILPRDLAIQTGELTPTMKVKRTVLTKEFQADVERLYAG